MTPRTFFTILIKIIGIYSVIESISVIPEFISSMYMLTLSTHEEGITVVAATAVSYLLVLIIFMLVLRYTVYRTDWLIDKLQLDKHFTDEKIGVDVDQYAIVQTAIIVMGGVFFVNALPAFIKQFYNYFSQQRMAYLVTVDKNPGWLVYYLVKLVISYILMTKSKWLTSLVEKQVTPVSHGDTESAEK